jgi:hypothetical protein
MNTAADGVRIHPLRNGLSQCPICGRAVNNTGRVCGWHFNIVYDAEGYIVSWRTIVNWTFGPHINEVYA